MKRLSQFLLLLLLFFWVSACTTSSPLEKLKKELSQYPQYSIILEDMKEEGNFFKEYYHKYKVIYAKRVDQKDSLTFYTDILDWQKVPKKEFRKYFNYLGMVITSKTPDGQVTQTAYPPGYQYVGNPRYGRWVTDSRGNSFWEFYGKWMFLSSMFNMFGRPVYRNDWNDYRRYSRRGEPWFGRGKEYGTFGSRTKQVHKSFFERRQMRERARKQSFAQRVKQRTRRSKMSGFRRRSGGFGK